ncbi:MAG: hypothetical protein ACSHWW_00630 [Nonlabens sp.]|uniref:hypothetical protein n=1 Tax=Nonlabens sp. TaxID=1888209 RepID=UPI003EFA3EC0
MKHLIHIIFFGCLFIAQAQQPVQTVVDRNEILMGEEVKLGITVEAATSDLVIFPEQAKFGAMEVIESYPVDTIRENDRLKLFKEYGITQWDSGDYYVPRLQILKNDLQLQSDSILVKVREVQVDTAKQKMFDIKPAIDIPDTRPTDWSWLWWLLLLIPVGILVYLLSRKREKKTYEETLQPYEWTRYRLGKLDEKQLIENKRAKEYYTELTYIIRKYIDSKVYGHALESTTGQLLGELKTVMAERGMNITATTETRLKEILERADLVKFAGVAPDAITAKEDRLHTTDIIYNIHQVLPPPTEEELMMDAKYRRKQELKARGKKIAIGAGIGVIAIAAAIGTWVYFEGKDNVKDIVLGNELREYYEQDWLRSGYGIPEVVISTPDVLVRGDEDKLPPELDSYIGAFDNFRLGESGDKLSINVATFLFKEGAQVNELTAQNLIGPVTSGLEKDGATNIIMLDKELEHKGMKGIEFSGNFEYEGNKYDYDYWIFNENSGMQQVFVTYLQDDEEDKSREYGRLIKERILESVEIAKIEKPKKQSGK